jgi:hypothetical protein
MLEVPFTDTDPFDTIPAGKYKAEVIEAKLLLTKANDGSILACIVFKILDAPNIGKLIFGRYNVKNQNAQAQQIAQSTVRKIYKAVGLKPPTQNLTDGRLEQLLMRPFTLDVSLDFNDYRNDKENNPKGYFKLDQQDQQSTQATSQSLQQDDKDFLDKKNAEFDEDDDIDF